MKLASLLTLAALLTPVAAPAATILFDEDFAEEALTIPAVGGEAPNAVGLDSFTFDSGSVDLYTDGGFGLPCPSAGCLDLDGSTGDAAHLRSIPVFTLQGGVTYQLTANVRGNARGGDSDLMVLGMSGGAFFQGSENFTLAPDDDWRVIEVLLQPIVTADARIIIFHTQGDNVGILLDRVTLVEGYEPPSPLPSPIPLPAPALLLMGSLGFLAMAGRRRRAASRAA
jgi:hypothetical protein